MPATRRLSSFLVRRFRAIIVLGCTEPTEIGLDSLMAAIGIFWLLPMDSFAALPALRMLGLNGMVSEAGLGGIFLGVASVGIIGIVLDDVQLRLLVAGIRFWMWLAFAVSMAIGAPANQGWVTYSLIALASAWVYVRLTGLRRERS